MNSAAERISARWLTLEETGIALKLKNEAVLRLIHSGEIYGVKLGKEWRVDLQGRMAMLGHTTIEMAIRYTHISAEHLRAALAAYETGKK